MCLILWETLFSDQQTAGQFLLKFPRHISSLKQISEPKSKTSDFKLFRSETERDHRLFYHVIMSFISFSISKLSPQMFWVSGQFKINLSLKHQSWWIQVLFFLHFRQNINFQTAAVSYLPLSESACFWNPETQVRLWCHQWAETHWWMRTGRRVVRWV